LWNISLAFIGSLGWFICRKKLFNLPCLFSGTPRNSLEHAERHKTVCVPQVFHGTYCIMIFLALGNFGQLAG